MTARWAVVRARVPDALDDEVAAVLGRGSLGVEVAPSGPGTSEVRVYVALGDDPEAWRERAHDVLTAHGLADAASRVAVQGVADGQWVERWQATLAPILLAERFVVVRSAADAIPAGRDPIQLTPGMAFGTGEHATTRLCAAGLERHVRPGSRWLDLGAGTGILAIVAARSGASRVLALDHDPECVRVAAEVVARNAAGGAVVVRQGSLGDRGGATFDGIVANIQASFFLTEAPALREALAPRGVLLASGLLVVDVPEVAAALEAGGLSVAATHSSGPWVLLEATPEPA